MREAVKLFSITSFSGRSRRLAGVTLIELIFVIAVIGILSTTGILFYQQRMQNQKVEKTVSQMEQWMQAGMAYYVHQNNWPSTQEALMPDYLPIGFDNSHPWCNRSTPADPPCYTAEPIGRDRTAPAFIVTAVIKPASLSIATAIAARLPYGVAAPDGGTVIGTVNVPLSGLKTTQGGMALVNVFPFYLQGKNKRPNGTTDEFVERDGVYSTFISDNEPGICLKTGNVCADNLLPKEKCEGADYDFDLVVTVTAYRADKKGSPQQPAFSVLSVNALRGGTDQKTIFIRAEVRPQLYSKAGVTYNMNAQIETALRDALEIQGRVFVFCKKKPTF